MHHNDIGLIGFIHFKLPIANHKIRVIGNNLLSVADSHCESINITALQLHNADTKLTDRLHIGLRQLTLDQQLLKRGILCADIHTVEVFRFGVFFGIGNTNQDNLLGLILTGIVVIGKLKVFCTGFCPGVAGDGHINGIHGNCGLTGVEAHRLDLKINTEISRNVFRERHIKADIRFLTGLRGIHKFHGAEVRRESNGEHTGFFDCVHFIVRKSCHAERSEHHNCKGEAEYILQGFHIFYPFHSCDIQQIEYFLG